MRTLMLFPLAILMTATSVLAQTGKEELTHELRNMAYFVPLANDWLTLRDGEYKSPGPQLDCCYLSLDRVAFGDLNGDDLTDAAVVLVWAEGNGVAFHVAPVLADSGEEPRARATYLDHGINLDSLWVDSGIVHVAMTRHVYDDAVCCPSLHLTNSYALDQIESLAELDTDPYEEQVIRVLKRLFVLAYQFQKEAGSYIGFTEDWAIQNFYESEPGFRHEYEPVAEISVEIDSTAEALVMTAHHARSVWSYVATGYREFERIRFEGPLLYSE